MTSKRRYFNNLRELIISPRDLMKALTLSFSCNIYNVSPYSFSCCRDKPWSTLCKKSHGIPSSPSAAAVAKFRLLTGHDCLCAHLFRFNLVTSPICVLCDTGQDMTAAHLDECSALNDLNCIELWFQQDGATCHTARATIDLLKDTFGDRLISRFGPVNWPPRSCDLTPLDYFLWGYVKSLVYVDKPQTLDHLEDNIRRVIADIRPQMLEMSSKIGRPGWSTSEPAVAVICQKSYLKYNAT
ncbi:transposable element Tc3 transposase [Trichonephila clavipes]|nr:transposable element Tc3 transposase [Trichonephila clavipes]